MPIISDTGSMSEYQRFGILEGKEHKKHTRWVHHAVLEGYDALSKTFVQYKESLSEVLQKHIFVISNSKQCKPQYPLLLFEHDLWHTRLLKIRNNEIFSGFSLQEKA